MVVPLKRGDGDSPADATYPCDDATSRQRSTIVHLVTSERGQLKERRERIQQCLNLYGEPA